MNSLLPNPFNESVDFGVGPWSSRVTLGPFSRAVREEMIPRASIHPTSDLLLILRCTRSVVLFVDTDTRGATYTHTCYPTPTRLHYTHTSTLCHVCAPVRTHLPYIHTYYPTPIHLPCNHTSTLYSYSPASIHLPHTPDLPPHTYPVPTHLPCPHVPTLPPYSYPTPTLLPCPHTPALPLRSYPAPTHLPCPHTYYPVRTHLPYIHRYYPVLIHLPCAHTSTLYPHYPTSTILCPLTYPTYLPCTHASTLYTHILPYPHVPTLSPHIYHPPPMTPHS